jgi:GntR family transcriptional repressor for pyruvate dehydrogenase complex
MPDARLTFPELESGDRGPVPRGVASLLQRIILRGGLKPGDRLPSQRHLADQLGVSRPSLREALSVLEAMGLIVIKVGSGAYVASSEARAPLWRFSDRASPRDVYEARIGLEAYAALLAARHIDIAGVERLERFVEEMRSALEVDDILGMAMADAAFHDLVFELAANPVLAGMYRPVRDLMVETQRLPMTRRTRLDETLREHEELCRIIATGDEAAAETAMKAHIRSAARRFGVEL